MATGSDPQRFASLINRLRGIYTVPVNDGAGLLNGSDTFTRRFEGLPPINEEAAGAIEELSEKLKEVRKLAEHMTHSWSADRIKAGYQILDVLDQ